MPSRIAIGGKFAGLSTICALSALALTGCFAPTPLTEMTPSDRVEHDYAGDYKRRCLMYTAYDIGAATHGKSSVTPPSAVYNPETGIMVISPVQGEALSLTGFDQDTRPVQPVDGTSKNILATYGCDTDPYLSSDTLQ